MKTIISFIKNYVLLIFLVCTGIVSAQTSFSVTPSSGVINATLPCSIESENYFDISIPEGLEMSLKVVANTLPPGDEINVDGCWSNVFYDWGGGHYDHFPVGTERKGIIYSSSHDIGLFIIPKMIKGNGQLIVDVWETAYPANKKTLTWNIEGCAAGTDCTLDIPADKASKLFKLYPNPAKDQIILERVNSNKATKGKVEVFNVIGKKILEINESGSNETRIDISTLQPGAYFVKCCTESEGILARHFLKVQ